MAKTVSAPSYLLSTLKLRFEELAPLCVSMGTLTEHDADLLAKYVIAESNYLQVTQQVQMAIGQNDFITADKWITLQDKLIKQCLTLGAELGLTPISRRNNGLHIS